MTIVEMDVSAVSVIYYHVSLVGQDGAVRIVMDSVSRMIRMDVVIVVHVHFRFYAMMTADGSFVGETK